MHPTEKGNIPQSAIMEKLDVTQLEHDPSLAIHKQADSALNKLHKLRENMNTLIATNPEARLQSERQVCVAAALVSYVLKRLHAAAPCAGSALGRCACLQVRVATCLKAAEWWLPVTSGTRSDQICW